MAFPQNDAETLAKKVSAFAQIDLQLQKNTDCRHMLGSLMNTECAIVNHTFGIESVFVTLNFNEIDAFSSLG